MLWCIVFSNRFFPSLSVSYIIRSLRWQKWLGQEKRNIWWKPDTSKEAKNLPAAGMGGPAGRHPHHSGARCPDLPGTLFLPPSRREHRRGWVNITKLVTSRPLKWSLAVCFEVLRQTHKHRHSHTNTHYTSYLTSISAIAEDSKELYLHWHTNITPSDITGTRWHTYTYMYCMHPPFNWFVTCLKRPSDSSSTRIHFVCAHMCVYMCARYECVKCAYERYR